jgi:anti-sigma regulatory factor (Ser/Thr protein kinase)
MMIGVSAAARYLPASDEVGGDWYDVFELSRGRLGVAIGDVVGHGLRAAALMGQLRTALHAYAIHDHGPGRTLELVDRFVQATPGDAMATAAYAVLDPVTGIVNFASAGHLPPLLIGNGVAKVIEVAPATPLGTFPYGSYQEHELLLDTSQTLVLYTDGLVERPGTSLEASIAKLLETVGDAETAEEVCQLAMEELVPLEGLRDDVALVAMQNQEIPRELRMRPRADPRVLSEIRRVLRRWLHDRDVSEDASVEITLAVCEACTNAIEHAYSPAPASFELQASEDDGMLTFVVRDTGSWRKPRGSDRGRGLTIIDAAMDEVQVDSGAHGTEVVMRRRAGQ